MELDDQPDMTVEPVDYPKTRLDCRYLLQDSSCRRLILAEQTHLEIRPNCSMYNESASPSSFVPNANTHSGSVISKIEDILQQIVDCVIDEEKELVLHLKPRVRSGNEEARTIRFPGKTAQEAWKFTVLLRILELSHEALVTGIMTTKRDIYYRDPELFRKQSVVDRYVDDVAFNFGVKREALNIAAAAKGLVAGNLTLVKMNKTAVDCRTVNEGILVPNIEEIDRIDMRGARWALVVEKEATFRSLVSSRFWETSLAGKGILVTGKGYPDIQTRGFVRLLSTHNRLVEQGLGSSYLRIFTLMDFDPDGLAIMSTYKHGSVSLAHENDTLITPKIEWLGIKSDALRDIHQDKSKMWLRLTPRDRKMALKMLEKPFCQESVEASWRRELQVMLMLNIKAEIQILGECSNLEEYLSSELQRHMRPT